MNTNPADTPPAADRPPAAVTTGNRPVARLVAHLVLLFCAGCAAYALSGFALLYFDGDCLTHPDTDGCWPVRLHLDQFLPLYATVAALLVGISAGAARLRRHRTITPVIRLIWLILASALAMALILR